MTEAIGNESKTRLSGVTDDDVKANSHEYPSTNVIDVCRALSFKVLQPQVMTDFRTVREINTLTALRICLDRILSLKRPPAWEFCCDGGMTVGGSVPTFDNCVIVYSLCCGAPKVASHAF